jgi:hypothetical protein
MKYRQVAGRLLKPGDVVRRASDGALYKIESIAALTRADFGTLRAQVRYSYGKGTEIISPDRYYGARQLPADVQMAQFISQLALGEHDASQLTVEHARKLLDSISGELPLAAVNEQLQRAHDLIDKAVSDGILPG